MRDCRQLQRRIELAMRVVMVSMVRGKGSRLAFT